MRRAVLALILCLTPTLILAQDESLDELLESVEELVIVTASKTAERLVDAPATVIVITKEDFQTRGYSELSQILDDLPGMEVVRPYGDAQLKNYWRGYRNTIGEPFLIMVDGIVFNHLYYNTADGPLVTIPISNIERVEVVYGPASSVYGANAFMGVINVLTTKDKENDGSYISSKSFGGDNRQRIADFSYFYKRGDLRLSATGRIDNGEVDREAAQRYEYLKDHYYADRLLWGGFVDNPNIGGEFRSARRNRSFDLRAYYGGTEIGVQYYVMDSGYGLEYAADLVQNNSVWRRPELSLSLRHNQSFGSKVSATSLIRYRRSDVSNDSYFVDAYFDGNTYVAAFSYWQSLNVSWSAFQDFDVKINDQFSFNAGLKYEQKNLQKAYDINGESASGTPGGYEPVGDLDASTYDYPEPPQAVFQNQNRILTEDLGAYLQARYRISDTHRFNIGIRHDDNSQYGSAATVRAGYVGRFNNFGGKILFGQAYQEPTPRLLYGGWAGAGSDPDLKPEESQTLEVSGSYSTNRYYGLISLWQVNNTETIVNTPIGAQNLADRTVMGLDFHARATLSISPLKQLKVWGYASLIFKKEEDKIIAGVKEGTQDIGDLADTKLWFGATGVVNDRVNATFRGRYVGKRDKLIDTNPLNLTGGLDGYVTADASVTVQNVYVKGIGVTLSITNLFDTAYDHPGIRDAGAGEEPGHFDNAGDWHGSSSYYSSRLPQPGRALLVSLNLNY